ncbi:gamma-glutamyltransferase [Paenibacillus pinistramenti]|uniref:gamma-glutamyltransferase n=1 Tax=Paenibacillus pinistramenti TaxID=1768003 RepID=UPI0011088F87|nr:gamma-glutamyltransferase [Paenibacillus pinistramenti]
MVVSPHALATSAGARILARGGNAYDAAVAISACLAVVYPHMTGIGGDSFWLLYNRSEQSLRGYNGSGRSGCGASRERFAAMGMTAVPTRGPLSAVTVPGMVDSWAEILGTYGTMALPEVLEPAIGYAVSGFPLSRDQQLQTAARLELLRSMPGTVGIYAPGGLKAPAAGSRFVQRELGRSLQKLAAGGRDAFYKGEIGAAIVQALAAEGGILTADDFADHHGDWVLPVTGSYRGTKLAQMPPNSQGFAGIMAAHIVENFDLERIGHGTYEYYHLLVEALKLSFRDRNRVLTDPAFSPVDVGTLTDKAYCAKLAGEIDMSRAAGMDSAPLGSDTAYAAVTDGEGNAVSFIQSLYFEFGSGFTAGDTGILLQNRGSFFSLDPAHVNRLEPRKRTFHTLMPAMALREDRPFLLYGTQGGEGQPQTQTALLTRIMDFGMDPQEAISAPRWLWGRTWGEETRELKLESRIPAGVADQLAAAGHVVKRVSAYDGAAGHAGAILIREDGTRFGGSDPRSDGAAIGW